METVDREPVPEYQTATSVTAFRMVGGLLGVLILVALLVVSITSGSPQDANRVSMDDSHVHPSSSHWFGRDAVGRDNFARVANSIRQSARVSGIATGLLGGFAVLVGLLGAVVRTLLPERTWLRWLIALGAAFVWLAFVHVLWRLPFVADVGDTDLSWRTVHAVHDATLAQVSAVAFALACMAASGSLALGGLRWGAGGYTRRTLRHLVGVAVLLFGLGCASLAVVDSIDMLGLDRPNESLSGEFLLQWRADQHWWDGWPALATIALIVLSCGLVANWLLRTHVLDPDQVDDLGWQHPVAVASASAGILVALARQLLTPTIQHETGNVLQWIAAVLVVVAFVLLVIERATRGARRFDLGTATWFVVGCTAAVLLHWPFQHHLEHSIADDFRGERSDPIVLLRFEDQPRATFEARDTSGGAGG